MEKSIGVDLLDQIMVRKLLEDISYAYKGLVFDRDTQTTHRISSHEAVMLIFRCAQIGSLIGLVHALFTKGNDGCAEEQ